MCSDQHVKYQMSRGFPLTISLLLDYHVKRYYTHTWSYFLLFGPNVSFNSAISSSMWLCNLVIASLSSFHLTILYLKLIICSTVSTDAVPVPPVTSGSVGSRKDCWLLILLTEMAGVTDWSVLAAGALLWQPDTALYCCAVNDSDGRWVGRPESLYLRRFQLSSSICIIYPRLLWQCLRCLTAPTRRLVE